jgi:hypothetical protein
MRIYSRAAAALNIGDDLCHPAEDGGYDLPEAQALDLLSFHADGHPLWKPRTSARSVSRLPRRSTSVTRPRCSGPPGSSRTGESAGQDAAEERAVAQTAVA